MPILYGLRAGGEISYEYDGGAVEGVDKVDATYKLKFGYGW